MTPGEIEAELETHHRAGFAWSLACCGRDREEAEDVLQASYLKILDGRAQFAGRSSFKTFLFGVIRRTASEARRRRIVREWFSAHPVRAPRIATENASDDRLALLGALARLPRRQREVLELVFYVGLTVEEAAETLGVSAGTARVHYDRGKRRMASLLGELRNMNEDGVERDLAARFERLRGEDDPVTPSFRAVYDAARRRAAGRSPRRDGRKRKRTFALIIAAAAIPIVTAVLLLHRPGETALTRPDANAIAAWKSPTKSLLDTPGIELYGEAPRVAETIPEWIFETHISTPATPALSTPSPKGVSS